MDATNLLEVMLRDKKLRLKNLKEEHITAIAVFEAKRELLQRDIDYMEKQFYEDSKVGSKSKLQSGRQER